MDEQVQHITLHAERWKPIRGYEGLYEVSDYGRVKRIPGYRCKTERILKPKPLEGTDYVRVTLCKNSVTSQCLVHRLVLIAFVGDSPPDRPEVRHLDGRSQNNMLRNLQWGTHHENEMDKFVHGTASIGERQHLSRLIESDVLTIRRLFKGGRTQTQIAEQFGVSQSLIWNVVHRKTWAWLQEEQNGSS